jgi:hypothetical protein
MATDARGSPSGDESDGMKQRVDTFLGEFRIMVPALGVLLGFQLTSAYSNGWKELGRMEKTLDYAAVLCTALALIFLLVPAQYHRSRRKIEESERFLRFAQHLFGYCFLFFAVSLVITVYLQGLRVFQDATYSLVGAAAFTLFLLVFWMAVPLAVASKHEKDPGPDEKPRAQELPAGGAKDRSRSQV